MSELTREELAVGRRLRDAFNSIPNNTPPHDDAFWTPWEEWKDWVWSHRDSLLALAARALLPDDDSDPTTHEWLDCGPESQRTFGRQELYGIPKLTIYKGYRSSDHVGRWAALINGGPYIASIEVPTRGHVRRLAALMGIELPTEMLPARDSRGD